MTATDRSWINLTQNGNSPAPTLTVDTIDATLDGEIYTLTIEGSVDTTPSLTPAQESITFSIVISTDVCALSFIQDTYVFADMIFTIDSNGSPTVSSWTDSDFPLHPANAACGPLTYSFTTPVPDYVFDYDFSVNNKFITVTTINPYYAGTT